jgi:hypothetical protein
MTVSRWSLLRIRNVSSKGYKTKQNSRLTFNNFFSRMVSWMHLNVTLYYVTPFVCYWDYKVFWVRMLYQYQEMLQQHSWNWKNVVKAYVVIYCDIIRCLQVCMYSCNVLHQKNTLCQSVYIISLKHLSIYIFIKCYIQELNWNLLTHSSVFLFFFYNYVTMQDIFHEHLHVFHHTYWSYLHEYLLYQNSLVGHFVGKDITHTHLMHYILLRKCYDLMIC